MKFYHLVRKWTRELSRYGISIYAANTSFYIILSVFPTIMLVASMLPYIGIDRRELLAAMDGLVPQVIYPLLEKIFEDLGGNSGGILLSTTAPVAIWSASGGIYCIRQGLNHIHNAGDNRSYLIHRLSSMLYTTLLILALVLTLILNGFGRSLVAYMTNQTIPIVNILGRLLRMRGVILMVLLTALFTAMYCFFPSKGRPFKASIPGAALSAFGWLIFTEGYSLYARFSGSYSILYGSLSILAMGMVWLYVCISILFYGCVLNIYLERK